MIGSAEWDHFSRTSMSMNSTPNPNWAERITWSPDVCNGRPVIRGTRITVRSALDYLAAGDPTAEILGFFPELTHADLSACPAFASQLSDGQGGCLPKAA